MDNKNYICPHCGESLAEYISELMAAKGKKGGSTRTEKKSAAGKRNMEKLNAAYTPEKRAVAAIKRRETMAAKIKAKKEQSFLFRWHRGSLSDSMETVQEFASYAELLRFVQEDMEAWNVSVTTLTFEHSGIDDRIGWDTWLVMHDGHCIGMASKNPLN